MREKVILYLYIFSCHIIGPLVKDETVVAFILALPRKLARGLVNRAALFAWWTGAWANEGDVFFLTVYLCVFYRSSHSSHRYLSETGIQDRATLYIVGSALE